MAQSQYPQYPFGYPYAQTQSPQTPRGQSPFSPNATAGPSTPVGPGTGAAFGTAAGYAAPLGHGRKRGADSPPSAFASDPSTPRAHDAKRRRRNLANGFQTLSIDATGQGPDGIDPHMAAGEHLHDFLSGDDDDDGLEPTQPPLDGDVGVEVLPDRPQPQPIKRPRSYQRGSSFSSTSPSEDDYESDVTFRIPSRPTPPVQATAVEHPPETPVPGAQNRQHHRDREGVSVEMLDTPSKRKHSEDALPRKRRREGMDVDMDGLPEGSYGPGWYEPEKDRIIVTSLSSPESSPPPPERTRRSMSPDAEGHGKYSYAEHRHLSQPGSQGFTISPSLLTHILNAQRDQFQPPAYPSQERGLVLYRPLGIAGDQVVQQWDQQANIPVETDSHRFEEVDSDEDLMTGTNDTNNMMGMDTGMDTEETGWDGGDEAMDIE